MHVIRLHGPWTVEISRSGGTESERVHLPREWSHVADFARHSSVALVRRFHRPTGLEDSTQVQLAVPGAWPVAFVEINGRRQASAEVDGELQRFNISEVIRTQEAHEVRIELQISADLSNAPCFVGLEITG